MSLLQQLRDANALRTLDTALVQTLRRLDPSTPDDVLAAAALASLAVANGHAGFDLSHPRVLVDAANIDWPQPDAWCTVLAASPWVSTPTHPHDDAPTNAPLVLEHIAGTQPLLYLRRYREYERRLAQGLHRIGAHAPTHRINTTNAGPPAVATNSNARRPSAGWDPATLLPPSKQSESATEPHTPSLANLLTQLFPQAPTTEDRQARAAALALHHTLLLVTGGPGTGKTTTIARMLALLCAQAAHAGAPPPRIALAAPTGRAAERMAESLRTAVQAMTAAGVDPTFLAPLPATGSTLHRLLGTVPDRHDFRHHGDNPLPFDIVVVDEASMIDLPLMAKLVEAVPTGARLVLLGDPDQLPSVEAGDVLAGILRAAGDGETLAAEDAHALHALLGTDTNASAFDRHPRESGKRSSTARSAGHPWTLLQEDESSNSTTSLDRRPSAGWDPVSSDLPTPTSMDSRLRGSDEQRGTPSTTPIAAASEQPFASRTHLTHGYRQADTLHLAPLATAIRTGDAPRALALLRAHDHPGIHFHENETDPLQPGPHRDRFLAHWTALANAPTPADALAQASRLRLLTAVREGPQGARTLNARIEALLAQRAATDTRNAHPHGPHFHGRLLLITENSYRHRLFNGDIGIVLHAADGTPTAWLPGDTPDAPRPFHPAALPSHESAFAMTVHKAQGSEFDEAWLLLPARDNRVLSRELVYTGITRARRELHIAASADVIEAALARHAGRWSGLAWRLGQ